MEFKDAIIKGVAEKMKEERERSGKFTPSRMGRCYRYQIAQRKELPESDPISPELVLTFDIGTMVHQYVQKFFKPTQCEVKVGAGDIVGYCDYVDSECVADFKTVGFWQWKKIENAKVSDIEVNSEQYCYQLMTYAYLLDKPVGYLVFIKKDDMSIRQFEIKLEDWKERIERELAILREYWELDVLPKGEPRAYGGKECQFCSYRSTCPDKKIISSKKYTKKRSVF